MAKDIFVFVEYKNGTIRKVSLELLTKGKELAEKNGSKLYAAVIGFQISEVAEIVKGYADKVIVVDNENLNDYRCDTYVPVLEQLLKKYQPSLIFGGSTVTGKDLFPRLAARLNVPIVSDAVGIGFDGDRLKIKKPLYGGKVISWLSFKDGVSPLVTFRPNSFAVRSSPSMERLSKIRSMLPKTRDLLFLALTKGAQRRLTCRKLTLSFAVAEE